MIVVFKQFLSNIVFCGIFKVLLEILMPENEMKNFVSFAVSFLMFFIVVWPICEFVFKGGINNLLGL